MNDIEERVVQAHQKILAINNENKRYIIIIYNTDLHLTLNSGTSFMCHTYLVSNKKNWKGTYVVFVRNII